MHHAFMKTTGINAGVNEEALILKLGVQNSQNGLCGLRLGTYKLSLRLSWIRSVFSRGIKATFYLNLQHVSQSQISWPIIK